jgi:hypothetical protein
LLFYQTFQADHILLSVACRIRYWPTQGPFSKQILRFLFKSNLPIHYKFTSTGYIFSYYALALAVPLSIPNFVLVGIFGDLLDNVYLPSWNVMVAIWVVFAGGAPIAFAVLRYRSGSESLLTSFKDQVSLPLRPVWQTLN